MLAPAKVLVIVNPVSGGGRARQAAPQVADLLSSRGVRADFVESQSAEDIRRRAAEAAGAGYAVVAVLGGDGAFHHAVNGAFGTGVSFAVFPAGNGNDIAFGLGVPRDAVAAAHDFARALLRDPALATPGRRVDVLRARRADASMQLFLGAGGMGLDAEAARLVNGRFRSLPGATRYIAAALAVQLTFQPIPLEAQIDHASWSGPILLAAVANGPCYGSGVHIAPAAKMDDGLLDVTLVSPVPWLRVVEAVPILLRTGDLRWPEIHRFRARRVSFRVAQEAGSRGSPPPALFHGDGEVLGEAPVEVEVLPGAIRVIG